MTYLKAVAAAKTTDADKVMAELKKMKIDDFFGRARSVLMAVTCTTCT